MRFAVAVFSLLVATSTPDARHNFFSARESAHVPDVSGMEYLGSYAATGRVKIWRGVTADIFVNGTLLSTSSGIEIRKSSGGSAEGMSVSKLSATMLNMTLRVTSTSAADPGEYDVLIHYPVELNGPDKVRLRLYERGVVSSIQIAEPSVNGRYLVGETYTVVVSGSRLQGVRWTPRNTALPNGPSVFSDVQVLSTTPSEARFRFRLIEVANLVMDGNIFANDFYNSDLGSVPNDLQRVAAGYAGASSTLHVAPGVLPIVASFTPSNPQAGAQVTVAGSRITPRGYNAQIRYSRLYYTVTAGPTATVPATVGSSTLSFLAPPDASPDGWVVNYLRNNTSVVDTVAVDQVVAPGLLVSGQAPVVQLMPIFGVDQKVLLSGTRVVLGKHLVSGLTISQTTVKTTSGGITGNVAVSVPSFTSTTQPAVAFAGTSIPVVSTRYSGTAQYVAMGTTAIRQGVDSLVLNVPQLSDTVTGSLTVTTAAGTSTTTSVYYAPRPIITALQIPLGNGQFQTVTNSTLIRGQEYRVIGKALDLRIGCCNPRRAVPMLNGLEMIAQSPAGSGALTFTVPTNASSGALVITNVAGSTTVGTFSVIDAVPSISLAGIVLSPAVVAGGSTLTATIAFNGAIPASGNAGNIVFETAPRDSAVMVPAQAVAVTSNPMVVNIPTKAVGVARSTTLIVRTEAASATNSSVSTSLVVRPPAPTGITLTKTSVTGGQTVTGTVQLNTTAPITAQIPIALASSDPTSATVPASVIMNGSTAQFTITTPVVPATRSVTISAASDGQTRAVTLTVEPPVLLSLVLSKPAIVAQRPDTATVTFSAAFPTPTVVAITCEDPALICPSTVTVSGTSASFVVQSRAVPASRRVNITASVNGSTRSATLDLAPLGIQSVTASPTSVAAGSNSSLTIQLNAPVPTGMNITAQIVSSDNAVARTANPTFATNDVARIVTISSTAPQAAPRTVTFTITLTYNTSFGPATTTATTTVNITP